MKHKCDSPHERAFSNTVAKTFSAGSKKTLKRHIFKKSLEDDDVQSDFFKWAKKVKCHKDSSERRKGCQYSNKGNTIRHNFTYEFSIFT